MTFPRVIPPIDEEPRPPQTPYLTLEDLAQAGGAGLAVLGWLGRLVLEHVPLQLRRLFRRWPWAG